MKQIIVFEQLDDNFQKSVDMISVASMAFVEDDLRNNAYSFPKYKTYPCANDNKPGYISYKNQQLDEISRCNFMAGKTCFAVRETYEKGKLISVEEVQNENIYDCNIELSQEIYEQWLFNGMPKVVLVGKDNMDLILSKAKSFGFNKYIEYFEGEAYNIKFVSFIPLDDITVSSLIKGLTTI